MLIAVISQASDMVALSHICFPKFNYNMVIDDHPALIVDSDTMHNDIIFDVNFLNECGFQLQPKLISWIVHELSLFNVHQYFLSQSQTHLLKPLDIAQESDCFGNDYIEAIPYTSLMENTHRLILMMLHLVKKTSL